MKNIFTLSKIHHLIHLTPLLFLLFFFVDCNKNSLREQAVLTNIMQAKLDSIKTRPILLNPAVMLANDSLLIIFNAKCDTLFQVFSQRNLNYLGWFGKRGNGPHEFYGINPSGFRIYNDILMIADLRKIYFLSLSSSQMNDNYSIIKQYSIPSELLIFSSSFRLDENKIGGVCTALNSDKSVDFFNLKTNKIGSMVDYPEIGIDVPENEKRSVYNYVLDGKPDKSMFAMAYSFLPLLRICDSSGLTVHETQIKNLPKQIRFQSLGKKEGNLLTGVVYYSDIKTTDDYIFLFYNPRKGYQVTEHRF